MAPSKVSLKLLIDKKGQRVLFAEAGKDFIDFLFSLLTLPIGTVMSLLVDNNEMVGGLARLYQSVSDLNHDYINSNQKKDVLLNPKSPFPLFVSPDQVPLLPIKEWSSSASPSPTSKTISGITFYKCLVCNNTVLSTMCYRCRCGRDTTPIDYVMKSAVDAAEGGGFVKGLVTYMVMDNLAVSPMSTISSVTMLNKFNIKDIGALEEKVVHIGEHEGLELLKHSLNSNTVLSNVFLGEVATKDA